MVRQLKPPARLYMPYCRYCITLITVTLNFLQPATVVFQVHARMSRGQWSEDEFTVESRALVKAVSNMDTAIVSHLLQWKFDEECLRHPPIERTASSDSLSFVMDSNDLFHDEAIDKDDEIDDQKGNALDTVTRCRNSVVLVWRFSVVYSHIWQCPVLYFTASLSSGQLLSRSQTLQEIEHYQNENMESDWNFLSYEEHPTDRSPHCFLHPCRTVDRMSLALQQMSPHGGSISTGEKLLSWMSMVLPSVGYPIASSMYVSLQTRLRKQASC